MSSGSFYGSIKYPNKNFKAIRDQNAPIYPNEIADIEEILNRVSINKLSHYFVDVDSLKPIISIDKGYSSLVAFNAHLRKNFYEFQTIRAAYFNKISRIVYLIFLYETVYVNDEYFFTLPIPLTEKASLVDFVDRNPSIINRGWLFRKVKFFERLYHKTFYMFGKRIKGIILLCLSLIIVSLQVISLFDDSINIGVFEYILALPRANYYITVV